MGYVKLPRPVYVCNCGNHAWSALTRGYLTMVSPEDMHFLQDRAWSTWSSHGRPKYAGSGAGMLHALIMNSDRADHADKNGFDNRRVNLRDCTRSQNAANTVRENKTGFRGVFSNSKKWGAYIRVNRRAIYLGNFEEKIDAAKAYDVAAIKHFGEFASLNFPQA